MKCGITGNECGSKDCAMYDEIYKMCSIKVLGRAMMWIGDVSWLSLNKPVEIIDPEVPSA